MMLSKTKDTYLPTILTLLESSSLEIEERAVGIAGSVC